MTEIHGFEGVTEHLTSVLRDKDRWLFLTDNARHWNLIGRFVDAIQTASACDPDARLLRVVIINPDTGGQTRVAAVTIARSAVPAAVMRAYWQSVDKDGPTGDKHVVVMADDTDAVLKLLASLRDGAMMPGGQPETN